MGLKLKIFIGYAILIFLLGLIVFLFRSEHTKRNILNQEMQELEMVHELTRRTYSLLLGLSSQAEIVSIWDEEDLKQYREKREKTCGVLKKLQAFVHSPEELARIDSVCLLLEQRELLLSATMNTFNKFETISETVEGKLPAIVRQVRKPLQRNDTVNYTNENVVEEKPEKKKDNFLKRIFGRKEKKSAYKRLLEEKDEKEADEKKILSQETSNTSNAAVQLLYSLNREVSEKEESQKRKLYLQMDSLYVKSRILNRRLNRLVDDLETAARSRLEARYSDIMEGREDSNNIVVILSLFVFMLSVIIYTLVYRDVNKRYRQRKDLEYLNRKNQELLESRDRMMLAVSHDLRAPLTIIRGYADAISNESDIEKRTHYRDAILQSSDNMLTMLNNLLLFYRLDVGKEQPNNTFFRLGNIADALETAYRLQAADKRLYYTVECEGRDTVLLGDRDRILQIGNNLLSNAIKFTPLGSVTLFICYKANVFCLKVRDTGTGIPKERLSGIFQPFERLENANTEDGFGLGLAVTREIVELLHGKIMVESIQDKGTIFSVTLPMPLADEDSVRQQQKAPVSLPENLYVAVVDNDAILLAMTVGMFTRHKICCDGYPGARELLEAMRERTYDVVVTDIRMSGINGFELLELLHSSSVKGMKTVPVIAATARVEKSGEEFLKAGFSGYLRKPFSVSELFYAVRSCIREDREHLLPKADFTLLLEAEKNRKEMLELFIHETRKDMTVLSEYEKIGDRSQLLMLVHHLSPVWENIRISAPLRELRRLLVSQDKIMDETVCSAIKKVIITGEYAIKQALEIIEMESYG